MALGFREGDPAETVRSWPGVADGGVLGREPELERLLDGQSAEVRANILRAEILQGVEFEHVGM